MRLPPLVVLLGYSGLIPFVLGPLWLTLAPQSAPDWLDRVWLDYVSLLAAFLAGTFWGFALPAVQGPNGLLGIFIASLLLVLAWLALSLSFKLQLYALAGVYALLLLADFWRERMLDTLPGYFALRATLTAGAIGAIAWRLLL